MSTLTFSDDIQLDTDFLNDKYLEFIKSRSKSVNITNNDTLAYSNSSIRQDDFSIDCTSINDLDLICTILDEAFDNNLVFEFAGHCKIIVWDISTGGLIKMCENAEDTTEKSLILCINFLINKLEK